MPEDILVRVNDTFSIKCYVDQADGELNFYDGDEMVPSRYVTVWWGCEILDKFFEKIFLIFVNSEPTTRT